jgi:DNA-binding transcriptional MerR regulator
MLSAGIPDKLYFKIGEVAEIVSLRPSVLRYWETEFEVLKPVKSRTGQRLYSKKNLELIFEIKKLLYSEKHTIDGARKKINSRGKKGEPAPIEGNLTVDKIRTVLNEVREDLLKLKNSLQVQDEIFGA